MLRLWRAFWLVASLRLVRLAADRLGVLDTPIPRAPPGFTTRVPSAVRCRAGRRFLPVDFECSNRASCTDFEGCSFVREDLWSASASMQHPNYNCCRLVQFVLQKRIGGHIKCIRQDHRIGTHMTGTSLV